jgi:hypothetical protein
MNMKRYFYLLALWTILLTSCNATNPGAAFSFEKNDQGVELLENGQPVFFYQKMPKSLTGEYICNNYLHPLYNLKGEVISEEFPADHLYHRGIFWAWHQIYINGTSVGNGWIMKDIEQDVVDVKTSTDKHSAKLEVNVQWKSPNFENSKAFVAEHTTITVHPIQNDVRKIDFAIALKALTKGVELGGADDEKGYGGLCTRIKLPEDIIFTSENRNITPQTLQVKAGPWMDFSGSLINQNEINGLAILCHPETPNYPAPWILRAKTSMQNVVFPGRYRIELPTDKPLVLYYRLIIHNGSASAINLDDLQAEYENTKVN